MEARAPTAGRTTLVLGVLGGIGSGKSEAARLLAARGGLVLDADRMAREELERPETVAWLRERFGAGVLTAQGQPDRAALAARVFAQAPERRALEERLHPAVRARLKAELAAARLRAVPRVVLDVPLLLENEDKHALAAQCDALVFVDVARAERERRVQAQRGWSAAELARREAAQMPLELKRARAQHVLDNNGDRAALDAAAARLLARLAATRPV